MQHRITHSMQYRIKFFMSCEFTASIYAPGNSLLFAASVACFPHHKEAPSHTRFDKELGHRIVLHVQLPQSPKLQHCTHRFLTQRSIFLTIFTSTKFYLTH